MANKFNFQIIEKKKKERKKRVLTTARYAIVFVKLQLKQWKITLVKIIQSKSTINDADF